MVEKNYILPVKCRNVFKQNIYRETSNVIQNANNNELSLGWKPHFVNAF